MITYRKPPTLGNILTKYKKIAMNQDYNREEGGKSEGCKHCGLCGNHGDKKNMIKNTDTVITKEGKRIRLKKN